MARQHAPQRSDPTLKKCPFCPSAPAGRAGPKLGGKDHANVPGVAYIDYKDYPLIKPLIDYFGNIRKRYYTGVCLKHQKMLKNAVERARFMGMLAYRK